MLKATGGGGDGGSEERGLTARVETLEDRWHEMNSLPTDSEMFRRMRDFLRIVKEGENAAASVGMAESATSVEEEVPAVEMPLCRPRQPMTELWHAIQLLKQVENNTAGITRV